MSAGVAGDGFHDGIFEGCISGRDMNIERRPYHKNCKCALHKEHGHCSHASRHNSISYPIRRTWSEGCLALMNLSSPITGAASPCHNSPSFVTAAAQGDMTRTQKHLVLYKEEDEEEEVD
ncbi:hypothetical protein SASPL_102225 [Salvia splendens]|uniref:Uncharacterized protein n=1 Tax=Salvia splendens TaxID=180675 RepID=A0A8X8YVW9_SALSN|nr:uncharacterized protein LOC121778989 [Salvia splendens]KAG6437311.1 hypothetical protein SASPL_102225 [Salvia splendens]